jgi:hypothetical protein
MSYRRSSRFGRKNKSTLGKKPAKYFSVFNPHTLPAPLYSDNNCDWIQIGSMDPAIYFFGLRCERIYKDGYRETIEFSLTDFTKKEDGKVPEVGKENFFYVNSITIMQQYCEDFLQYCQYIVIESQLSYNYDMVRMSSHLIAIMCLCLKDKGNRPIIIELDSKLKSNLLGAPSGMKKVDLKKWCAAKARDFFEEEQDQNSIDFMDKIATYTKDFDLGDAKCQIKVIELLYNSTSLPPILSRKGETLPPFIIQRLPPRKESSIKIVSRRKEEKERSEIKIIKRESKETILENTVKVNERASHLTRSKSLPSPRPVRKENINSPVRVRKVLSSPKVTQKENTKVKIKILGKSS